MSQSHGTDVHAAISALGAIVRTVETLARQDARLCLTADKQHIQYNAPRGVLTDEARAVISTNKATILAGLLAARGDVGEMLYDFRETYKRLTREEIAAWGKAHGYPRLVYAWLGADESQRIPQAWIAPGAREWARFTRSAPEASLALAYAAIAPAPPPERDTDGSEGEE